MQMQRAGREIADARAAHAMTREQVSARAGVSSDTERRIERGEMGVQVDTLCAVAEAVGLDIVLSAYPGKQPRLRDSAHLQIAEIVVRQVHRSWEPRFELTAGEHGEAIDIGLFGPAEIIDAEIERRFEDFQHRYRRCAKKRDWLAAHHQRPVRLVIVVEDTPRNRAALRPHTSFIGSVLPAGTREVLRALRIGQPLGNDGLLWIRRRDPPRA